MAAPDPSLWTLDANAPGIVAKRKSLWDDRPVEINELTFVIKQDLSALNRVRANRSPRTRKGTLADIGKPA